MNRTERTIRAVVVGIASALGLWIGTTLGWSVFAQQQPDPSALARIIPTLQQQRNEAMDKAALAEARAAQYAQEIERLKAELEKMKATDKPVPPQSP